MLTTEVEFRNDLDDLERTTEQGSNESRANYARVNEADRSMLPSGFWKKEKQEYPIGIS